MSESLAWQGSSNEGSKEHSSCFHPPLMPPFLPLGPPALYSASAFPPSSCLTIASSLPFPLFFSCPSLVHQAHLLPLGPAYICIVIGR